MSLRAKRTLFSLLSLLFSLSFITSTAFSALAQSPERDPQPPRRDLAAENAYRETVGERPLTEEADPASDPAGVRLATPPQVTAGTRTGEGAALGDPLDCTDVLTIKGRSTVTMDALDDTLDFGGQVFVQLQVEIFSDDDDSMNGRVSGYDPALGWVELALVEDMGNGMLFDGSFDAQSFTQIRIELEDTDFNEFIYYEYEAVVCRTPVSIIEPKDQTGYVFNPYEPSVYTYKLTNCSMAPAQFALALEDNEWTAEVQTVDGNPLNQTPLLADLESFTFRVKVLIPPTATIGEFDTAKVTAAAGDVSATASFTTRVLDPGYIISDDGFVYLFDKFTNEITDLTIDLSFSGNGPLRGALSPDGSWLYVTMMDSNSVAVIDTKLGIVDRTVPVGSGPQGVAFSADGAYAFVANQWEDTVSVIDAQNHTFVQDILVGLRPINITTSPCEDKLYVTNRDEGGISVIDPKTLKVTDTIDELFHPKDVVFSPFGRLAYVTLQIEGASDIAVIDTETDTLLETWSLGGEWFSEIEISPDGRKLFVGEADEAEVVVIDAFSGARLASIPTPHGRDVWDLTVSPKGDFVYASDSLGYLHIVDAVTNQLVRSSFVGGTPRGLAFFPASTECSLTGTFLTARDQAWFGRPGELGIFDLRIYNFSADSAAYDLTATATNWPISISMTNTGEVAPRDWADFVVIAGIPEDANLGDAEAVQLTVASAADPAAFTEQMNLEVKVMRPGYVVNEYQSKILIVDTFSHSATNREIDLGAFGYSPLRAVLNSDSSTLFVGMFSDEVAVIDTETMTVKETIPVGDEPVGLHLSPDGSRLYVANQDSDDLSVIDTAALKVTETIPTGNRPLNLDVSPCLDKIYLTQRNDDSLAVIDSTTLTVTEVITGFSRPYDVVVSPLGDRAYVSNQWANSLSFGFISVLDTASDEIIDTWPIPESSWLSSIDISPDGRTLYVADAEGYFVHGIDTTTGEVVSKVEVNQDGTSWDLEVFPYEMGPYYYASNPYDPSIAVVNTETNQVEKTNDFGISAGLRSVALFPASGVCGKLPTARFTPASGKFPTGQPVAFTNLSAGAPEPAYAWDFGDGETSTEANPAHVFAEPGEYTVSLTATNLFSSAVFTATLTLGDAPSAGFTISPRFILPGQAVTFNNESTGTGALEYTWDFGDESPASHEASPTHTYAAPGEYTVRLTVQSEFGEDTLAQVVKVSEVVFVPVMKK